MDVIIAARLSQKKKGRSETSIESQDIDAREWAEDEGHNVVATVADQAKGPTPMWRRKNLRPWVTQPELMARYQGIVAAKQDRLSRADWEDEEELRRWATNNGKTLFIVDKNLRWPPRDDPRYHDDDVSAWHRGAEEAHREWTIDSRRYKRMHKNLIANGYINTRIIFGYRTKGVNCGEIPCRCEEQGIDDHSVPVIYEPEAQVIREAVLRYLAGESLTEICDDFNTREIPSPRRGGQPGKKWHIQTLASTLRKPSIAGRRLNAEGKTTLLYDGIITWREHEQLVARLDSRANRKGISPSNAYMLTGLLTDQAGHPMHGHVSQGVKMRHHYYRCRQGCGFMIKMGDVDAEITSGIIDDYGHLPHMVPRIVPGKNNFEEIARKRQDRAELDDQIDQASDPTPYQKKRDELTAEIRRLIKEDQEHPQPDGITWVPSGKTVEKHWETLTPAARRDWLKENGWKVTAIKDSEMPNGWRLTVDSGWTAAIGDTQQAESLGFPAREYMRELADLPKRLGIPPVEKS